MDRIGDYDGPVFVGEHLRRVLVLPDDTWLEGWKLQSIELYDDGLVIRGWSADDAGGTEGLGWDIEDDLGTRYEFFGGGGGGGGGRWTSECEVTPAVPRTARMLTIVGEGAARVRVPLPEE